MILIEPVYQPEGTCEGCVFDIPYLFCGDVVECLGLPDCYENELVFKKIETKDCNE